MKVVANAATSRDSRRVGLWLLVLLLAVALGCAGLFASRSREHPIAPGAPAATSRLLGSEVKLDLPPPDLVKPVSVQTAITENENRPFSTRADPAAKPFSIGGGKESRERAIECLAQAVYYEAASDGVEGEKAVAQVVLNRVRHPAYPNSICGVVYQGSERVTGCQFTFTCDGSLSRVASAAAWRTSRKIAEEALSGQVFGKIGHSTYYHADYVLPYWADSLEKVAKVGRHIFYRLPASLGAARAFRQKYAGEEDIIPSPSNTAVALESVDEAMQLEKPAADLAGWLAGSPATAARASPPLEPLAADLSHGTLIVGSPSTDAETRATKPVAKCESSDESKQLRPLSPNDVRSSGSLAGC